MPLQDFLEKNGISSDVSEEADAAEVLWKQKIALRDTAEDAWDVVITAHAAIATENFMGGFIAAKAARSEPDSPLHPH